MFSLDLSMNGVNGSWVIGSLRRPRAPSEPIAGVAGWTSVTGPAEKREFRSVACSSIVEDDTVARNILSAFHI